MTKTNVSRRVTATILSMSLLTVMAGAAIAPALGIIKAHFSEAPAILVQFIVSMPALLIIVTNLFFLPLSRVLRTRAIATTGLLLYVVAGAGCFFMDDIHLLLAMRALLGVSVGLIMPLSTGLMATGVGVPYLNTIASIKGGKNSATTVMPLLSAALYLGQFVSPLIVMPLSKAIFGVDDIVAPYKVGIALCLVFLLQVYGTRHFQSLPPVGKDGQ